MICLVPDGISQVSIGGSRLLRLKPENLQLAEEAPDYPWFWYAFGNLMGVLTFSLWGGGTRHHLLVVTEWSTHSRHWKFKYQRVGRFTVEIDQYLP